MLELVIFLSTLPIVWTGTVPTSYACLNSHATIQFDKYKDANSTVKYWKKENNGSKVILASIFLGRKDYYETYLGNISVDENKNLRIDNVSYNNEGTYEREIINLDGGTLKQSVFLNVLEPPSGLPKINKEKDDSGNMIVSCINSSPHERPEAAVVLKNNAGNMQSQFKYAVNEIVLKCCIEGESVSRCYPKHLSRCSYHILSRTNERFSSGTEDRETNIKESHCRVCIGVHLGSFAVCFAIFSVYVFFTKPGNNKSRMRSNKDSNTHQFKTRVHGIGIRRLSVGLMISSLFLILSTGYLCIEEDCYNYYLMILVGVCCFYIGMYPSIYAALKPNSHKDGTTEKKTSEVLLKTKSL